MNSTKFSLSIVVLLSGLLLLCGCPPPEVAQTTAQGEFLASKTRLFDTDADFDIRDKVIHPERLKGGSMPDASLGVSNRQLFINRCLWCHECGADKAFDWADYGTDRWNPQYIGNQWATSVMRMRDLPNSFLNEQIAERIFTYLRDDTLGIYVEEEDESGKILRPVDEETYRKLLNQAEDRKEHIEGGGSAPPPGESTAEDGAAAEGQGDDGSSEGTADEPEGSGEGEAGEGAEEGSGDGSAIQAVLKPADFGQELVLATTPLLHLTDHELFKDRCLWCHDCEADTAFDLSSYGDPDWSPRYLGGEWEAPVRRMQEMPSAFLNEMLVERPTKYLHDDSLELYDRSEDLVLSEV